MSHPFDQKDEKIIQQLKQMPRVTDERSKNEIYHAVEEGLYRNRHVHRPTPWKVPVMTAVAVILLFLLFTPSFTTLWQNSALPEGEKESTERAQQEKLSYDEERELEEEISLSQDENEPSEVEEQEPESGQEMEQTPPDTEEPTVPTTDVETIQYTSSLTEEELQTGETFVTIPLLVKEEGTSFIIPLTFKTRSDKNRIKLYEQYNKEYSGEELGFDGSPLQHITWEEKDGNVVATFEKDVSSIEKEESEAIVHGIEESLRFIREQLEVQFTYNGEVGVQLGNFGRLENYPITHDNRGYYVYSTDSYTFLVSGKGANISMTNHDGEMYSLEETLERMKKGKEEIKIKAAIPEGVVIDHVQDRGDTVHITFDEGTEWPNEEQIEVMVDAMLFAAKDFGYEQVIFEGENIENLEEYGFKDPVRVPVAPNKVD